MLVGERSTSRVSVRSDLLERLRIRFLAGTNVAVSDRRQLDGSKNAMLLEETSDDAGENGAVDSSGEHHAETTSDEEREKTAHRRRRWWKCGATRSLLGGRGDVLTECLARNRFE